MTAVPMPPHPGPVPAEFAFPFAEARAVLPAGVALERAVAAIIDRHHAAAALVRGGFEGETRTDSDRGLAEVTARLDGHLGVSRHPTSSVAASAAIAALQPVPEAA